MLKNGKGKVNDLEAWFGGDYVISSTSKHQDLDLKYLKFYASRFPALAWEKGAAFPAQKVEARASDTPVAKTLLTILADAKQVSGTTTIDRSTPQFSEDHLNAIRELSSGLITPEQFCAETGCFGAKGLGAEVRGLFGNEKVSAALVLPGLLVIIFSLVVPIGFSAYFSLTDWAGFGKFHMVGLQNYKDILFSDEVFWRSLMNALILMVVTVFIQNPAAFALAALLAHITERFSRIFRTIFFIPAVLSLIVVAKLWVSLFNPTYGIIDKVLIAVGLKVIAVSWLSNPHTALGAVIWIIIWQGFGWALLFYYTGLMTVPREIEEATRVDGAGGSRLTSGSSSRSCFPSSQPSWSSTSSRA